MKKLFLITLLMSFIVTFTACTSKNQELGTENPQTSTSDIVETKTSVKEEIPEETTSEDKEDTEPPKILPLRQAYFLREEWQDDVCVLYSKYSNVTMWEGAEQYPEITRVLSETEGMQRRSMEDEADNILSFVREMSDVNAEGFEMQVSKVDVQVRRADSVAVSLLTDSYADYGFIEDFRGVWGSNYDAQTGKELAISDVILDMDAIPGIVLKELNNHVWAGNPYSETVVKDYFKKAPLDSISWTLDYNGVTFYFEDGDLAEPGSGQLPAATVSFAEYPALFNKKYMNVPEAYMLRLPLDRSYFTDLDGDGSLEELCCTGLYYEADRCYTKFGIYTDLAGSFHYEDLVACDFRPFYVKTEDGNHYIYLFCEENEVGKHVQGQMKLIVYNVNGGVLTRVGDMNIAPAYIPSDIFVLPLDPDNMLLDNYDNLSQDAEFYTVGSDGMPLKKAGTQPVEVAVRVNNVKDFLEAIAPGATITFAPGYYNLSEYTDEIWKAEGEEWNRTHPYVKLRECFDGGIEVVVQNVNDILIMGTQESDIVTELVVETRYGAVLNFEDCNNVILSGLTMGHTQAGACDESVLTFSNSSDIYLSAMDLYGCGMYGFTSKGGSGNIYVQSSIIRDCEAGPFYITEPAGRFEFKNCSLTGSFGGGYYETAEGAELSFVGCSFGTEETNYWFFDECAVFTDCIWEEITEYPDVEPEGEF